LHIPIIPFMIKTEGGVFKDGIHMDANELVRYISSGKEAVSSPPDEAAYTEFFAEALKKAHHLIHISLTTSMSKEFKTASEAAKAFDNVTVVNSECLSSAAGILVLIGYKLMQQGMSVDDIVAELEAVKHRLKCSFIINTTEYMAKRGLVSRRLNKVADALNLHPALRIRNDRAGIGGVWFGRTKRAYRKYINSALPPDTIPDPDVVFITYVDVPEDMLTWIKEEIGKTAYFENVIFQQASAAISSNCGPGTFGILYFLKSNKSYNIASFINDATLDEGPSASDVISGEYPEDTEDIEDDQDIDDAENTAFPADGKWYRQLKGMDVENAIKNSGSEEAFKAVLKIFYDSMQDKHAELENSFSSENWENYIIKIHALKSSAKLVGATELSKKAERLEMAGKENDIRYIKDHHESAMNDYLSYREALDHIFSGADTGKPVADEFIMESIYDELHDAAENMDCDKVEAIMKEISGYAIPETEKEKFDLIRQKADNLDYDGMLEALGK
ncbi:MAG: DegV family EDD domain-containing protein, partial [Lachnospiraceae bacterium]|nr:DegV family EDD domain-containing protein [Lachnospiraceae bacterium]MBR6485998.1 DegV family EDD domain-containing protein [Lachnospiraceae bacterium]